MSVTSKMFNYRNFDRSGTTKGTNKGHAKNKNEVSEMFYNYYSKMFYDSFDLIDAFVRCDSNSYESFLITYDLLDFQKIYENPKTRTKQVYSSSDHDIAVTQDALTTACIFLKSSSKFIRIGAMYLLYVLFKRQPSKKTPVKINMLYADYKMALDFVRDLAGENILEPAELFYHLDTTKNVRVVTGIVNPCMDIYFPTSDIEKYISGCTTDNLKQGDSDSRCHLHQINDRTILEHFLCHHGAPKQLIEMTRNYSGDQVIKLMTKLGRYECKCKNHTCKENFVFPGKYGRVPEIVVPERCEETVAASSCSSQTTNRRRPRRTSLQTRRRSSIVTRRKSEVQTSQTSACTNTLNVASKNDIVPERMNAGPSTDDIKPDILLTAGTSDFVIESSRYYEVIASGPSAMDEFRRHTEMIDNLLITKEICRNEINKTLASINKSNTVISGKDVPEEMSVGPSSPDKIVGGPSSTEKVTVGSSSPDGMTTRRRPKKKRNSKITSKNGKVSEEIIAGPPSPDKIVAGPSTTEKVTVGSSSPKEKTTRRRSKKKRNLQITKEKSEVETFNKLYDKNTPNVVVPGKKGIVTEEINEGSSSQDVMIAGPSSTVEMTTDRYPEKKRRKSEVQTSQTSACTNTLNVASKNDIVPERMNAGPSTDDIKPDILLTAGTSDFVIESSRYYEVIASGPSAMDEFRRHTEMIDNLLITKEICRNEINKTLASINKSNTVISGKDVPEEMSVGPSSPDKIVGGPSSTEKVTVGSSSPDGMTTRRRPKKKRNSKITKEKSEVETFNKLYDKNTPNVVVPGKKGIVTEEINEGSSSQDVMIAGPSSTVEMTTDRYPEKKSNSPMTKEKSGIKSSKNLTMFNEIGASSNWPKLTAVLESDLSTSDIESDDSNASDKNGELISLVLKDDTVNEGEDEKNVQKKSAIIERQRGSLLWPKLSTLLDCIVKFKARSAK